MSNNDPEYPVKMGKSMMILTWVSVLALLTFLFSGALDKNHHLPESSFYNGETIVKLKQDAQGHYVTKGFINDKSVTFLVDTGATSIAIPITVANQLGLEQGPSITVNTASGTDEGYLSRLESVQVGEIRLLNISAVIIPNKNDDEVLLGMSFIKHLDFSQTNQTLTLRLAPEQNSL